MEGFSFILFLLTLEVLKTINQIKMKKLFIVLILFIACDQKSHPCDNEINSNGFIINTDQQVMLASSSSVELFKEIDKAWFERDYEKIRSLVADSATLRFANGDKGVGPNDLISLIKKEYEENTNNGIEWGWTTDYAFSVKNTPTKNPKAGDVGEWVLAEFTSEKFNTIEWYQFNDGKLINWYQFNAPIK